MWVCIWTSRLFLLVILLQACVTPSSRAPYRTPTLEGREVRRLAEGMGFTEGPVWFTEGGFLVFSDIPEKKLMRWSSARGLEVYAEAANPNGNLLDLEGRRVAIVKDDIFGIDVEEFDEGDPRDLRFGGVRGERERRRETEQREQEQEDTTG